MSFCERIFSFGFDFLRGDIFLKTQIEIENFHKKFSKKFKILNVKFESKKNTLH
jgi:hypothetical protein